MACLDAAHSTGSAFFAALGVATLRAVSFKITSGLGLLSLAVVVTRYNGGEVRRQLPAHHLPPLR